MIDKRYMTHFMYQWFGLMRSNKIQTEAAAMAFISLLSLVPVLILAGWLTAHLPQAIANFRKLENFLLKMMIPESTQLVTESVEYLLSQSASISIASLPVLLLSVMGLMASLQQALDRIFSTQSRGFLRKARSLFITIVLGPPLLAMTIAASEIITTFTLLGWIDFAVLPYLTPLIIECLILTSIYLLIPSRSPGWKLSLLGGFLLTISLLCLRSILEKILVELGSYKLLYGIFAALPLFFIWVYGFWVVVFVIAAFLRCLQIDVQGTMETK